MEAAAKEAVATAAVVMGAVAMAEVVMGAVERVEVMVAVAKAVGETVVEEKEVVATAAVVMEAVVMVVAREVVARVGDARAVGAKEEVVKVEVGYRRWRWWRWRWRLGLASQERELRLIGLIENLSKVDDMQNVSCRPAPWAQPSGSTHRRPLRIQRHETRGARLQETLGKTAEALGSMQTETLAMVGELTALEQRTAALEKPSAATLAITTGGGGRAYLKTEQSNIVAQIVSCAAPLRPADLSSAPATHEGCRAARACREPLPSRSSRATRRPWRASRPC